MKISVRRRPVPTGRSRRSGFTLIEVVIALAIAAVSLGALTATISQMVDGSSSIRERTYASWIAQNRIAEMRLANVVPDVSTTTSEVTYANLEWQLETTVSETGVENLYRIDVQVTMVGSESPAGIVTGFIGEPTIPGDANAAWAAGFESGGEDM
jgi:general secretion pathway protein I